MTNAQIRERILEVFPDASVEVQGDGCNASVRVQASEFADMSRVQRQKAVLQLFAAEIADGSLHALSVSASS